MLNQANTWRRLALAAGMVVAAALAFLAGRATSAGGRPAVTPGPARVFDGVGVGFARTLPGAEAAAAHDLLELERAMDTLSVARTVAVAKLVATQEETRAVAAHASVVVGVERSDGVPLRRVAIATDPVSYSRQAAQVTVLECWLYATAAREAVWAIERVSLTWARGDWRVSAITGAAPAANESLAELRSQLLFPGPGDASVR